MARFPITPGQFLDFKEKTFKKCKKFLVMQNLGLEILKKSTSVYKRRTK